jgi:hypothetical protein
MAIRLRRIELREIGARLGRLGRGSKNGPLVGLQDVQPMGQILSVVRPWINGDPKLGTKKRGAKRLILTVVFERISANRRSGDDQNGFRGVVFWSQSDPTRTSAASNGNVVHFYQVVGWVEPSVTFGGRACEARLQTAHHRVRENAVKVQPVGSPPMRATISGHVGVAATGYTLYERRLNPTQQPTLFALLFEFGAR